MISRGEQTLPEAELLAEEQAICALPHRRAFNARKCEAFARAACDGTSCRFEGYGNCSGLLLQRGVFVTAAHCTDALMSSPETLAASRVVFFERQPGGWHQTEHALGSITPLKHVGEAWLTTADGRADVAAAHRAAAGRQPQTALDALAPAVALEALRLQKRQHLRGEELSLLLRGLTIFGPDGIRRVHRSEHSP